MTYLRLPGLSRFVAAILLGGLAGCVAVPPPPPQVPLVAVPRPGEDPGRVSAG